MNINFYIKIIQNNMDNNVFLYIILVFLILKFFFKEINIIFFVIIAIIIGFCLSNKNYMKISNFIENKLDQNDEHLDKIEIIDDNLNKLINSFDELTDVNGKTDNTIRLLKFNINSFCGLMIT